MTANTFTPSVQPSATLDCRGLPRLCWQAAHRAAREARGLPDGSPDAPETVAFRAAWLAAGATEATRWAATSLGIAAAFCRPYRARTTIGARQHAANLAYHGRERAAWIARVLTRGNIAGPERLPGAGRPDPWRGAYGASAVTLAEAA